MNLMEVKDSLIAQLKDEKEEHAIYTDGMIRGVEVTIERILSTAKEEIDAAKKAKEDADKQAEGTTEEGSGSAEPVESNPPATC